MKKFLAAAIAIFLLFSCETSKKSATDLSSFIPASSKLILRSPDFLAFLKDVQQIPLLNQNPQLLDSLPKKVLISVIQEYSLHSGFVSITETNDILFVSSEDFQQKNLDFISQQIGGNMNGR